MPSHLSHGRAYIEPERHDELSVGVPEQVHASDARKPDGTLALGASIVPALGGKAHKGTTRLSHRLDASTLEPKFVRQARALRNALRRELAAVVGAGVCGVAASLLIKFAAQKTAAGEQAFQAGDFEAHRKLSESARMDILYAREHAAKEAAARHAAEGDNWRNPWLDERGSEHANATDDESDEPTETETE